ncbi:MAG: metallophosphoesterase [candidate division KSB1 bacterium]|nr:metallophosphoesterase [candidate division KSB1 bacterium]
MYLAVFGDVHGNLDAMYEYVRRWERKHEKEIAAVLQVGDMGVFQPGRPLDKATKRYADKDPTELGCADYISGQKQASHRTLFVRGNHEDFDFLLAVKDGPVDYHKMIWHLYSSVQTIEHEKEIVRVGGLGGIVYHGKKTKWYDMGRKYFTDEECDCLLSLKPGTVDILLFHEAPRGYGLAYVADTGAEEVTLIIEYLRPRYAFYGHYEYPPKPFRIGDTLCVGMNNPHALRLPRRGGAMGVVDTTAWVFEFVPRGDF